MSYTLSDLMFAMLSSAGMRLPILIAVSVSLVWVLGSRRGQIRSVALWGLGLMGVATLLAMFLSVIPPLLITQVDFESVRSIGKLVGWGQFALNMVNAFALVLVVWAMTRALRDRNPTGGPPSRI